MANTQNPNWMTSKAKVKILTSDIPDGYGVFAWNNYQYKVEDAVKLFKREKSAQNHADKLSLTAEDIPGGYVVRKIYS